MFGASLLACVVAAGPAVAAQAMRDPSYRGVQQAVVLAQYGPAGEIAGGEESDRLCAEVLPLARRGSPVSIACARIGDRALTAPGTLAIVVQASVTRVAGIAAPLFAVAVRTDWQGGLEPAGVGFGAAPRIAPYTPTPAGRDARAHALDAALGDVLPWRRDTHQPSNRFNRE